MQKNRIFDFHLKLRRYDKKKLFSRGQRCPGDVGGD